MKRKGIVITLLILSFLLAVGGFGFEFLPGINAIDNNEIYGINLTIIHLFIGGLDGYSTVDFVYISEILLFVAIFLILVTLVASLVLLHIDSKLLAKIYKYGFFLIVLIPCVAILLVNAYMAFDFLNLSGIVSKQAFLGPGAYLAGSAFILSAYFLVYSMCGFRKHLIEMYPQLTLKDPKEEININSGAEVTSDEIIKEEK